jgi:two-component system response regulator HydG
MEGRVLVVDDVQDDCDLLCSVLAREGLHAVPTTSVNHALDQLEREDFDVVLTDLAMVDIGGIEMCKRVSGINPGLPVVVVTGAGSMAAAVAAMRAGAYDFITKPIDPVLLGLSVARAIRHRTVHAEVKRLRDAVNVSAGAPGIVGSSRAMQRVHETIARVADSDASVLVRGETGVGKELVARRIHASSNFRSGPFVAINCAAVPATLLESELFGHARGAFTDAKVDRTGLFVRANQGTLFLDEIGELPVELQPKLLRALQERRVRPVGGNAEIPFETRLIAASNRDLEEEIAEKRFREDLYYRINVVQIELPPLRRRDGDVLEVAHYFLEQHAKSGKPALQMSPEVADKLMAYQWPGNVRELENCIARAVAFARHDQLSVEDLPEKIRTFRAERFVVSATDPTDIVALGELERRYVQRVLTLFGGNKSHAAAVLGIDRRTLYRKIERWNEPLSATPPVPAATS